jgi:Ras-related protein Rab-2A
MGLADDSLSDRPRVTIVVGGNSTVGKSQLVYSFVANIFKPRNRVAKEAECEWKLLEIDGRFVDVTIWDCPGHETYRPEVPSHCRRAAGAVVVYDVMDRASFQSVPDWMELFRNAARPNVMFLLLGNRCDYEGMWAVSKEEGEKFAKANNALFMETSARDGTNVHEAFSRLVTKILEQIP